MTGPSRNIGLLRVEKRMVTSIAFPTGEARRTLSSKVFPFQAIMAQPFGVHKLLPFGRCKTAELLALPY